MSAAQVEGDLPEDLACVLSEAGRIAVDTETSGLDWAVDDLHLCQLFTQVTGPVLLRNVDGHPERLASILGDPEVLKVFHFAPFDLRFLEARWGVRAASVACTKAASRLVDPTLPAADHSLAPLVKRHLGVAVAKGPVRTSDWGAPVLTAEQLAYAAEDVAHLLELHTVLIQRLRARRMLGVYEQVCAYLPVDAHLDVSGIPSPLTY